MRPWRIGCSGLTEDRTVALEGSATWPVIDHVHEREAARGDFIDHEAGRHAVTLSIPRDTIRRPWPQPGQRRRKVDDRENPAKAHGAQELDVRRRGIAQVMVDAPQHHGVAAINGQAGIAGVGLHNAHVPKRG